MNDSFILNLLGLIWCFHMQPSFMNANHYAMIPTVHGTVWKVGEKTGSSVLLIAVSPCLNQFLAYTRCSIKTCGINVE